MHLSEVFAGISRIFKNFESFGPEGYKLWKGKLSKKNEVVEYNLKGVEHPIYLRSNTSDHSTFWQIFIDEQYEYKVDFSPLTIIDCGANIGLTSVYYANKYPQATIIAVEPETSNFTILEKNTRLYPNIHCLKNGIWNKKTNLEVLDPGDGKWGFVTKEVAYQNENTISAISINEIAEKFSFPQLDIVKIDIEGSEKKVFSDNYKQWLDKTKLIIIEFHDRNEKSTAKTFFTALGSYEYKIDIKGENLFCEILRN